MSSREQAKAQARAEREAREQAQARAQRRRRQLSRLGAAVGVAAVVVVVLVVVSQGSKPAPKAGGAAGVAGVADVREMLAGIPQDGTALGDPKAPVVMTEFADLQCPFCRDYTLEVMPHILERYVRTGKLRLELRLLRFVGPDSGTAARVAQAAAARDRMWTFVDLFYRNQGQENSGYVTDAFLRRLADAAGLPASLVSASAADAAAERGLKRAETEAAAAGVTSTPSFLIGPKAGQGKALDIARIDVDAFAAAIEPELKR